MKALGDHEMRNLQRNDIIQLERRGYFRVDQPYLSPEKPLQLFMIPDGKAKAMSTLSTNLAHK
jgi:glutamyl-tRNA synthetase